jgi:uncharacterized protein involved in outer membrane biogenesis
VTGAKPKPGVFSWLKKMFIGLSTLIFLLFAVLFAIFVFLQNNPSRLQVVLETVATQFLGRELHIGELLESELGLESYLLARDVTLANPAWAKDADFVSAGRILVRISLPSIWQDGPILIRELELEDAAVSLITAQDNPANWDFWPEAPQPQLTDETNVASKSPSPVFPLRILTGSVTRGALTIHSGSRDTAVLIDDLALSEPSEGGLLNLDLKGAINNIPLKVKGKVGPTVSLLIQRDLYMEVAVQLGELFFQSTGNIDNLVTLSGPDLQVDISSLRSRPLLNLLGIPGTSDGPFNFKGHVSDAHPGIAVQAKGVLNGIEVQLSGEVDDPLAVTGLQMELELHGPSIGELGAMLGVSGLPDTPYDINGTLESMPMGAQSLSVQFLGPSSRLLLDGNLGASPDFLGSHLNMELSGKSQAAFGPWLGLHFLPTTEFQVSGALTRVDSGWQLSEAAFSSDELKLKLGATVDQLPQPASLMAQVELSSANISSLLASYSVEAEGAPALPIAIEAVISGAPKSLKIDQMTAQSGATRLKVSGLLGDLSKRENINLAVELKTANLMELLPAKGEENVPALPLDLQGKVIVTADGLGVEELKGTMGVARLALQGNLNLVPPLKESKFSVQFEGPNLGAVLNPWLEREIPEAPFQLAMKADFSSEGVELSQLEATVDDAQLSGQITITDLKNPATARGNFKLEGSSSWKLNRLVGNEPVFSDASYLLNVGFNNSDGWLRVNPIALLWGNSDLSGSVNYKPGSVATLELDLYSKFIDIDSIVPSMEQLEKTRAEAAKDGQKSESLTSDVLTKEELADRVIPNTPLDFSPLKRLQGSFKYTADEIYVDDETRSSTSLDFVLKDGLLSSRKLHWDGTAISGETALSVRALEKGGEIDIRLDATRIPILALLGGEAKYDANAQYRAHIKSTGESWREMAKSASGAVVFYGGGGRIDNNGAGLILGDVFDQVFSRLNPLKETDRYTKIVCHAGAFSIVDGKVSIVPGAVVRTKKLDFAVGGSLNLHNEKLDLVFSTRSRKGLGISASKAITPYFKLGGTLAYPGIVLDPTGIAVSGGVAVATAGMSILAEGLWDRWIATADNPCKKLIKQVSEKNKKVFRDLLSPVSIGDTAN